MPVEQRIVSPEPGVLKRLNGNSQCGVVVRQDDPVCRTSTSRLSKAISLGKGDRRGSRFIRVWDGTTGQTMWPTRQGQEPETFDDEQDRSCAEKVESKVEG